MIRRLLVANRGEVARRVIATCRRLGVETVAVHSDPDAGLPHVAEADLAVRLPGAAPADTYLRGDLLVEAARRSGADAVHPGYGFLSENAAFARAVEDAGLVWVGPTPASIEAMGSKVRAKEIMREAGVPVLEAPDEPTAEDLPLLVKASAGGGGRGMRVVRDLAALPGAVEAASAEAASAFGDGTVFVEPYVEHGRHVEVQVWGNHDGTEVSVLGARDCSVQRRHQKVVEEAPPPGLSGDQLAALHDAARAAARALAYVGVGTVELLVDADDPARFWFLEMNTRLQVEHPVTEAVLGVDLVALQLAAAEGTGPSRVEVPAEDGHAVEVRLYAEDPAAGYRPESGRLVTFDVPHDAAFVRTPEHGVRLDAGYVAGTEVSTHYDPMLAKVVAWGPTREAAVRLLAGALRRTRVHGVRTNLEQLLTVLDSAVFARGGMTTTWLEDAPPVPAPHPYARLAPVAAAIALAEESAARRRVQQGVPAGWRNVVSQPQHTVLEHPGTDLPEVGVDWWGGRDGYRVDGVRVLAASTETVRLEVDGVAAAFSVAHADRHPLPGGGLAPREVWVDGPLPPVRLREVPRFTDPAAAVAAGSLLAPMPGTVVRVAAEAGAVVRAGDPVLVLEAMKMQHTVAAPVAGTVSSLLVGSGQQVAAGEVLAVVEASAEEGMG
jgi:propionyl-CoA carboxylase alpha chain